MTAHSILNCYKKNSRKRHVLLAGTLCHYDFMYATDAAAAIDKADAETNIPNETDCDTERDSSASVVDSLKKRDQRASVAEQSSEVSCIISNTATVTAG